MTHFLRWLWPGGIVLLLDLALLRWAATPEAVAGWTGQYGWMVLAGAGLLAWRFRRSRTVALVAVLVLLTWGPELASAAGAAAGTGAAGEGADPFDRSLLEPRLLAGTLVLLGLSGLAITRDRSVLSPIGGLQVLTMVGLAGAGLLGGAMISPGGMAAGMEGSPVLAWLAESAGSAPRGFWVSLGLAGLATAVQAVRLEHTAERGLFWTAVGLALVALSEPGSVEGRVHLAATGLILLLTSVETSYALAFRDELTGLPTRRALVQFFDGVLGTCAVAMVDVDHFKRFNDRHGHDVGDQVLKMVASRLARVGGGGTAFRYGGEEFTVVFPGKTREEARPHLEALRKAVEDASFTVRRFGRPRRKPAKGTRGSRKTRPPRTLSVTVSIGVAERGGKTRDPEAVIKAADRALYRAKRGGRNRVAV